ncbi:large subunit GTPase LSG1 [Acrasis kona]|uniref:Large subunit GTPase LSG1 n=1 Tax=Acrasis kona TaxID=1008807 RepID=A0AAW2YIR3_9EUKA
MGRTQKQNGTVGRTLVRSKHKKKERHYSERHKEEPVGADEARYNKLHSIIEQNDLQSFLHQASESNRDFTAERGSVTFVVNDETQTFVMSEAGDSLVLQTLSEEEIARRAKEMRNVILPIPRRPKWSKTMTKQELDASEKKSFLKWRKKVGKREEELDATVTPYEKNLEVWRQLWRVIERSHVVVQIVDCRNPLLFRSLDLEKYVQQVSPNKRNVLLMNKADLLTERQRFHWAKYFAKNNVKAIFFSAALEQAQINDNTVQTREEMIREQEEMINNFDETTFVDPSDQDATHIFTKVELLFYFKSLIIEIRKMQPSTGYDQLTSTDANRVVVGLVGYPNVGKSSTVNVLCGKKRVAVGATPGKTKHLQTLPLGKNILLADCPGLVFPSVAITKEEMVLDGILPIDQLREHRSPVALLCKRIPKRVFELTYGLDFEKLKRDQEREDARLRAIQGDVPENDYGLVVERDSDDEEEPKPEDDGKYITCDQLLNAYAISKGLMSQKGVPNHPMASRNILKEYVAGKLLYCHRPPREDSSRVSKANHIDKNEVVEEEPLPEEEEEEEEVLGEDEAMEDDDEYFTESDEEDQDNENNHQDQEEVDEYAADEFNVNNVHLENLLLKEEELYNKEEAKRKRRLEKGLPIVDEQELVEPEGTMLVSKPATLDSLVKNLTPKQQKRKFATLKKFM